MDGRRRGHIDRGRLEQCRNLRRLQVLAGLLVGELEEPALRASVVGALERRL